METAESNRMYLVCEHKTNGTCGIPNSLSILDEEGLVMAISRSPGIRMVKKAIKPGCTCVDIFKIDLVPEESKAAYAEQTKGVVEVPWKEFFGYEWAGHSFEEMIILVPEAIVPSVGADGKVKVDEKVE